ncbi:hypothetical protein ELI24_32695 (plasmid) [Rhizobium ruizarguesonis]|uniref:Uncharacterized protein n=1 Tax=Rhizobium leguminosarum TaxID=384 RepID=A0A7M3DJ53_RHILE|nr:hypothetical protein ELI48_31400 [Rhizobium ruizarguesonis]TAU37031.1 hypothetical protein ELI43_34895 [Rhizobium leguminosarum]TAU37513.1 hypothetical protein ELI42_35765 [Rhizobium ruizarguesonis]TAU46394.1 hypothetical protein ELI44_33780 [Rhizobium ruizarguesonis]TAU59142.1 hypothetical protein ELI45_32220 [Rhizobium ruizarguesonis]
MNRRDNMHTYKARIDRPEMKVSRVAGERDRDLLRMALNSTARESDKSQPRLYYRPANLARAKTRAGIGRPKYFQP